MERGRFRVQAFYSDFILDTGMLDYIIFELVTLGPPSPPRMKVFLDERTHVMLSDERRTVLSAPDEVE